MFEHLTVEQNLKVGAHMRKIGRSIKDGLEMVYHYFPRLREKRNETAGFISGGEQQMTVVGRALMTNPKLILLDEPSMGLAPLLIHEIFNIIQQLNQEEKISILLVEQNAKLALNVAPSCLRDGKRPHRHGRHAPKSFRENPDIKDFLPGPDRRWGTKKLSGRQTLQAQKTMAYLTLNRLKGEKMRKTNASVDDHQCYCRSRAALRLCRDAGEAHAQSNFRTRW